jgi:DNA-binding beta-propeller fold protein YncE
MRGKKLVTIALLSTLLSVQIHNVARAGSKNDRALGDSKVIAPVPFPGYPEGIAVHDGLIYTSGPAAFGVPGNFVASKIFAFDEQTGALVKTIVVQGQQGPINALSCIAFGDDDDLYVIDEGQGVLKINVETGQQSVYSSGFHPVYASAFNPPAPVLLNDLAFDKHGYLYVTDSFEATIWRVPPGGGAPEVWFQNQRLDGPFGPNGVRVDPKGDKLYFTQTFDSAGAGYVYTLPLVDHPSASDLQVFHAYNLAPGAGPDGIAFGRSGKLYVALAGYSQISVLMADGSEAARYSGPAQSPSGDALPWANPANIAFNNRTGSLLITNHASLTGLPDPSPLFAVFDLYVNDRAGKLFKGEED